MCGYKQSLDESLQKIMVLWRFSHNGGYIVKKISLKSTF